MLKLIHHLCLLGTWNRLLVSGLPVEPRISSRSCEIDQESPLNKTENVSVDWCWRWAEIALHTLTLTHTPTHTVTVSQDRVTDYSDPSKRTAGLCCAWESPFQKHGTEWWKVIWSWAESDPAAREPVEYCRGRTTPRNAGTMPCVLLSCWQNGLHLEEKGWLRGRTVMSFTTSAEEMKRLE